jgi:DNA repair protein RadC
MEQSVYDVLVSTLRDPAPSPEDVALTKAVHGVGKLLDIELLDHLVIGKGKYVSLKAKGLFD